MTRTTESSNKNFIVLLEEVETTVTWHEGCNLLAILDQLDADRLTDSRVRLLGLNSHFLEHDALGVRRATEGIALEGSSEVGLLVVLVGPLLDTTVATQLTSASNSTGLSGTHAVSA